MSSLDKLSCTKLLVNINTNSNSNNNTKNQHHQQQQQRNINNRVLSTSRVMQRRLRSALILEPIVETATTATTTTATTTLIPATLQQTSIPLMNYYNNQRQEPSELEEQQELHPVVKINSTTSARRRTTATVMIKQEEEICRCSKQDSCIMTMRQLRRRQARNGLAPTTRGLRLNLICLVPALAALFLLAACLQVDADAYALANQHQDSSYQSNGAANNHYDHQQQGPSSKAKKIQIVYIKVPLAKLKPSLANSSAPNNYNANDQQAADNSTAYASQHVSESITKQQGSQSVVEQRKQLNALSDDHLRPASTSDESQLSQYARQQSSFLIPMAVVSNSDQPDLAASAMEPSSAFQPDELANLHRNYMQHQQLQQQQQQQQHNQLFRTTSPMMMMRPHAHVIREQPRDLFHQNPFNQQQLMPHQSQMHFYQQLMNFGDSPQAASQLVGRTQHVQPGFMSSFLLAEKERMAAAAMRLARQQVNLVPQQTAVAKAQSAVPPSTPLASASSSANAVTMQPATAASSTESQQQQQQTNKPTQQLTNQKQQQNNNQSTVAISGSGNGGRQTPGGLMPVMMMPLSHMPDTMIGQAYNAAVGQALPSDTGSPSSLLSSPSNSYAASDSSSISSSGNSNSNNSNGNSNKGSSNYATGGNNGIVGDSSSSLGTSSSTSYGANGHNQHDATSSGTGYQQSASASANYAPSSAYGSGINTFGASVAFSDFPTGSYGGQVSSSNNHPLSHSAPDQHQQAAEQYAGSKLRQAKKTIIPIVVQVEHAILENNAMAAAQNYAAKGQLQGNRYGGQQRGHRQVNGGKLRGGYRNAKNHGGNSLFGSATNESPMMSNDMGAQYLNAANAQDINQITAQINAENAASAAAALAQADMAFGNGSPAYLGGGNQHQHQQQQYNHHNQRPMHGARPSPYAAGLQSAASALLANTHPVIQAAASGGLASVSKLGAKLGEMMALPSMQVQNSISALPSALSSMTSQMGVQMSQAIQQVAKEHPTAHAFARQVAQHAGIQLPNFVGGNGASNILSQPQQQQQQSNQYQGTGLGNNNQQMSAAASNQQPQQQQMSPQAQLQNLKLSIGQNLQTAAAQLIGVHQKANAQSAASLLANPLAALYPQSMNAALKQLSGGLVGSVLPSASAAVAAIAAAPAQGNQQQQQAQGIDSPFAQSSSLVPVQQQPNQNQPQQQQQLYTNPLNQQAQLAAAVGGVPLSAAEGAGSAMLIGASEQSASSRPAGKPSLKSKFLSFFQPPKFISNLLSWNDRADARNDQGAMTSVVDDKAATAEGLQTESKSSSGPVGETVDEKAAASDKASTGAASNVTSSQASASSEPAKESSSPVAVESMKGAKEENSASESSQKKQ